MPKLNIDGLRDDQLVMLYVAINRNEDGQHPVADRQTIPFFDRAYVIECLAKARDKALTINPNGMLVGGFNELIAHFKPKH